MAEETILIKRYDNRKLYDTSRSTYVTLEDIAGLIREGREVKVVDSKTNEDLTKSTLALIILEEERRTKTLLPLSFMYQVIKYGESIQGVFQDYLSTGFDRFLESQQEVQKKILEWTETRAGKENRHPQPAQPAAASDADTSLKDEVAQLKQRLEELERHLKTPKAEGRNEEPGPRV